MKTLEIKNKRGISFVVIYDDDDDELIKKHDWYYAYSSTSVRTLIKSENYTMHRLIMGVTDPKILVDHINHNTLDNRKCNLRLVNHFENGANRLPMQNKTSKYKGVSWYKNANLWRAGICHKGIMVYQKYFKDEIEAAKAYDKKAKEIFGEYALVNFEE